MVYQNIFKFLKSYSTDPFEINRIIVSAFLEVNKTIVKNNKLIKKYCINKQEDRYGKLEEFKNLINKTKSSLSVEDLIHLFEFVVSPEDKEINGAVYTPKYIREFIIQDCSLETNFNARVCDVACGCGGFLYEYALYLNKKGKKVEKIIEDNLYGIDITEYSIERTKILLSLFAITKGEDKESFNFNLYQGDSLSFNWFKNNSVISNAGGFDYIFSNPPYVGSTNLIEKTKALMKKWQVSSTGKLDLYIPFFELGLEWLKEGGTLGYITVNNFYRSLNGRALRKYFSDNKFNFKFIDFGGEQVFKGRNTYTCICEITKEKGCVTYTSSNSKNLDSLNESDFVKIQYEDLDDFNGWKLDSLNGQLNLKRIENIGVKLGEIFNIRNGFATLRNYIYLFSPIDEDDEFYYFEKDSNTYKVEKEICRDAIKPNILKSEKDLINYNEKIIFPYYILNTDTNNLFFKSTSSVTKVFSEEEFLNKYPNAYYYLEQYKDELAKRDRGNRDYETWFAYGRTQALNIRGKKLLFPYLSNEPYFVYTENEDLLFYNGYALISDSKDELIFAQKILKSDLFWYYIRHTSKPYSGDYFALAKNYVKNFSIPHFTRSEKKYFMNLKRKKAINKFLLKKYNLVDIDIENS